MLKENASEELLFLKDVFPPEKWKSYFRRINLLSSPDRNDWKLIDFPLEIAAELTNYCNLECVICPVPTLKRNRGFMDESVFGKIVHDISKESGYLFLPQGFGEPLLHNRGLQMVETAVKMGIQPVVVLTNGNLLNEANIKGLISNADIVIITVDGVMAKTYEAIRVKGSFERVTNNIKRFIDIRGNRGNPRLVLRIIRMKDTEKEIDSFRAIWSERLGSADLVQVSDFNDWTGSVIYRGFNDVMKDKVRYPCKMFWKNLTVYHNGDVSPCCYDAEGELIIGNVLKQSISEIWEGSPLMLFRQAHINRDFDKIPLCARCRSWL